MKLNRQTLHAIIIAALSMACVLSANAAPVVWTLDGVTRSDGGTVTGSFTYDAATNTYSAINIISTPGSSSVPGEAYGEPIPAISIGADFLYMARTPVPADLTNQNAIFFGYPALTDAGGTLTLGLISSETLCASSDCTGPVVDAVRLSGQVTTTPPTPPAIATPVPTISAYGLAFTALGLLILAGGRLRTWRRP